MSLDKDRWKTITESQFPWEQEALDFLRKELSPPWALRAWSNFEIVESSGRRYEVDLLLLTVQGFFLVEIKSYPGLVYADEYRFVRRSTPHALAVSEENPLTSTNHKCKVLKNILTRQSAARNVHLPHLHAVVFLSHPDVDLSVRPGVSLEVYTRTGFLQRVGRGARVQKPLVDTRLESAIVKSLAECGISTQTVRTRRVGDWVLGELLGEGPEYQDYLARHASLETMQRRVRIYTAALNDRAGRERAARAARREFQLLDGISHEGILRPNDLVESELGLGLLFDFYPEAVRLDHFLPAAEQLDLKTRLALWRQLADILRYAHDRRILHRSLAPQNVLVIRPQDALPRLKVMNWQTGRAEDLTTGTQHIEDLVEDLTTAYLAPETLTDPASTGPAADLFSLGCVGYYLLSGQPPASSQVELMEKLSEYPGLRLQAVLDACDQELCELVEGLTHPDVNLRLESVAEFLQLLDRVEAKLAGPEPGEREVDPFSAAPGEHLGHGLKLVRRLGQGAISTAFLVERGPREQLVLKLANKSEQNHRLEEEAEVLSRLKDRQIVELRERVQVGERTGLLLSLAGEKTLSEYLAETGTIPLELLQRFGDDLLRLLQVLEQEGVFHRDVKPSNLGVARLGKNEELHLMLFDFSLSRASPGDLTAGTSAYLDPFLSKRKRWDVAAERYAAAVTLYEMATGSLPRWGDGKSHPALVECELELESERFEPSLRESMTCFFTRALARDASARFDNAEEMRQAWGAAFASARPTPDRPVTEIDWRRVGPDTPLAELTLSATALQALDRAALMTAAQLLAFPRSRLRNMKGLGARTRREILEAMVALEEVLAAPEPSPTQQAGLDRLVERLVEVGKPGAERLRRAFLGLEGELPPWPSLAEVAQHLNQGPLEVSKGMPPTRTVWRALAELADLRDQLTRLLAPLGGVASAEELAAALLGHSGSLSNDPAERMRRARAALRAALEVEALQEEPRFSLHRLETGLLVSLAPEHVAYAVRLGERADQLALQEPLPGRLQVVSELRDVPRPEGMEELSESRLLRLAVETARKATLSSKSELYPRGMEARRALVLAHGALLGELRLPPARIKERVESRYPEALPLPGRPELDALLTEAGLDLVWNEAQEAYLRRDADLFSSSSTLGRRSTSGHGPRTLTPEVLAARETEERLTRALSQGEALVLTAPGTELAEAEKELTHRFGLEVVSLEERLLGALHQVAEERKIPWDTLVKADAAGPGSPHWDRLTLVVGYAATRVEQALLASERPLLLKQVGLLARYQPRLELIERALLASGQPSAPPAVWVLASVAQSGELPTIDRRPIPLPPARAPLFLPREWLRNLHRAASA